MKKVVCIGGGSGQSALLKGLKQIDHIELSTIVAMADNGGSTGRLRNDLHLPAMGDVRNVMVALADSEDLMTKMMNYRFDKNAGELAGHNLGNIIISALTMDSHDFYSSIEALGAILKVKGNVYPSTIENVTLCAHMKDGSIVYGESEIRASEKAIEDVFYKENVKTYQKVVDAIMSADYIIIGIGSLYTSIMPNLIIAGIKEALCECKGKVIYYCNSMTEQGETDNYSLEQHVAAIEKHVGAEVIDAVVCSSDEIPVEILENYYKENAREVLKEDVNHRYRVFTHSLLSFKNNNVRHDPNKVTDSFMKVMEEM